MDDYESYDLQDEDPYLTPESTCLQNLLGITDTKLLNEAEAEISAVAHADLIAHPINPTFDLDHLRGIHLHLFKDVYSWAGELRKSEIGKGGKLFLPHRRILSTVTDIFRSLHEDHLLKGLGQEQFARQSAYYLGRINMVHPFREGNGRAQRILLDQLAELSGYGFAWSSVSGEHMAQACRDARQDSPDYRRLERLLKICITEL